MPSNMHLKNVAIVLCACFRLGEVCSHVAAVLFKIEAATRLQYNQTSCTSEPCLWNQTFVKKVHITFVLSVCCVQM